MSRTIGGREPTGAPDIFQWIPSAPLWLRPEIRGGALGPGLPHRDLFLSPDHAIYREGVLIPVKYLINGTSIAQVSMNEVTYYHLELAQHAILLAEGLPAESYLDTGDRANFANGGIRAALHPDFASSTREAAACAPLVITGPVLEAIRHRDRQSRGAADGTGR